MSDSPATRGLTVRQFWQWLSDRDITDLGLDWAPDLAALTGALLERSHAFRFVVSPPPGATWPPGDPGEFGEHVAQTAAQWRAAMDAGDGDAPEAVRWYWETILRNADTPLAQLSVGDPWTVCEACLALHAIADEASAGVSGGGHRDGPGAIYRARARELLTRTGTMSRLPADRIAQLPKSRTTSVGITHRSISRYGSTTTDGIGVTWHRGPLRRRGSRLLTRHANVLLLPWPLRIKETDFVKVRGSVQRPEREPFGFFNYEPSEALDLDLVDRLIAAARDEVDDVDAVVLPEGYLAEADIAALEARLAQQQVPMLVTGLRPAASDPDRFPGNGVHVGVLFGDHWLHYRQNKHHRWFLDGGQIGAYNIAGALHPSVRWWEAMDIPERSVHILELGGGITVAAVVCEDLARLDGVAHLLRSIGPTLVLTLLLDGPQLSSRWTARYASVLADDPGSAVLTLTALGMATRSRPPGTSPSRVIAMWKDPVRGLKEISLDPGAQGVLLKAVLDRSTRHAADGRAPVDDVTDFYIAGVHQLTAGDGKQDRAADPVIDECPLDPTEFSVVSSWADAIADAVVRGTADPADVVVAALPDARWRAEVGVSEPSGVLREALIQLGDIAGSGDPQKATDAAADEDPLRRVVGLSLRAALESAVRP